MRQVEDERRRQCGTGASSLLVSLGPRLSSALADALLLPPAAVDDASCGAGHHGLQVGDHLAGRRHALLPRAGPEGGRLHRRVGPERALRRARFRSGRCASLSLSPPLERERVVDPRLERPQSKSATKPARIDYLDGIEMLDIAAGQASTFFIARPPSTQAAKDEAKTLIEAPTPPPAAADAAPESAPAPAAPGVPAVQPSYDISGFGFSFGPPAAAAAAAAPAPSSAAPTASSSETSTKRRALGISRTRQEAWEELARFPPVLDATDNCQVCGGFEADEVKGDILECEKVRRSLALLLLPLHRRLEADARRERSLRAVRGGVPRWVPKPADQGHPGRCALLPLGLVPSSLGHLTDSAFAFCMQVSGSVPGARRRASRGRTATRRRARSARPTATVRLGPFRSSPLLLSYLDDVLTPDGVLLRARRGGGQQKAQVGRRRSPRSGLPAVVLCSLVCAACKIPLFCAR